MSERAGKVSGMMRAVGCVVPRTPDQETLDQVLCVIACRGQHYLISVN